MNLFQQKTFYSEYERLYDRRSIEPQEDEEQQLIEEHFAVEYETYNVLGLEFPENILLQRTKSPLLLLYCVFLFNILWPITFFIHVSSYPTLFLYIGSIFFGFFSTIFFLQLPINDGIKLGVKEWIFFIQALVFMVALFAYPLLPCNYLTPLGSFGIYMMLSFLNIFFLSFTWILALKKTQTEPDQNNNDNNYFNNSDNENDFDDLHLQQQQQEQQQQQFVFCLQIVGYQVRFFSCRVFLALIITLGLMDAYSHFALSRQISRSKPDVDIIIVSSPALIFFGMLDLVLFVLSIKFSVSTCIVINKIILLTINGLIMACLREFESIFLGFVSLVTTTFNYTYHLYIQ